MSRYIDADALLKKAEQEQRFYMDEYNAMESGYTDEERELARTAYSTMTDCVALIINAPTVDAVPVVRCKDCVSGITYSDEKYCKGEFYSMDFFCADGKRRTE